jgi:hypothetical protein
MLLYLPGYRSTWTFTKNYERSLGPMLLYYKSQHTSGNGCAQIFSKPLEKKEEKGENASFGIQIKD